MELNELKKQVTKLKRRVGQGISAGQGKTAGRGTKGQKARTGRKIRPGFEGGQMPLVQRVPKKRGFKALGEKPQTINLKKLSAFKDGDKVTLEALHKAGIIENLKNGVKIVGDTEVGKKLTICVPTTKKAAELIKKAGGTVQK